MVPMRVPEAILIARKGWCVQQGFLKQEMGSTHPQTSHRGTQVTDGKSEEVRAKVISQPLGVYFSCVQHAQVS